MASLRRATVTLCFGCPGPVKPRVFPTAVFQTLAQAARHNTPFESLQASGGSLQAGVNIAYHLALLECGLTHPDVLVPSILIIDSPRKALGSNPDDQVHEVAPGSRAATKEYGQPGMNWAADFARP
ncbi:hypothetical protein ACGFNV_46325 [Streptomyces sp. NPDC048751]|uniref:hypothetical protein n=1 Tax=Streptomyces sp. NPDC048751 TaxID=3365591 RepID=UPI00371E05ED